MSAVTVTVPARPTVVVQLQGVTLQVCADAEVSVNSVPYADVGSGASLNVQVVNTASNPVGALFGSLWIVARSIIRSTASNFLSFTNATVEFVIPDVQWTQGDGTPQTTEYGQPITCQASTPVTVENSDASYSTTANPGTTLVLPDINTNLNGDDNPRPAVQDINVVVVNTADVQVGDWRTYYWSSIWEIADSIITANAVPIKSLEAEQPFTFGVELDGVPVDVWDAGLQKFVVVSNPSTGWVRNPDWPVMPVPGAEQFLGLKAIFENQDNKLVYSVSVATTVDHGDGTSAVTNGTTQTKLYDYASISATVYVDPLTGENYKMVMVSITRISTNITNITFTGNINWLDIAARLPNITIFNFANNRIPYLCQRFVLHSISASYNPGANERIVQGMSGLRSLTLPWSTFTAGNVVCNFLGEIDDLGDITANINLNFSGSKIKKAGTITINSATNLQGLFDQNPLLQSLTAVIAPAATNAVVLLRLALRLRGIVTINMPLLQNISQFAQNSPLVGGFIFTNAAAITTTTSAFDGCFYLWYLVMNGLTRGVNLTNSNIGFFGMNVFANSLGTAVASQFIVATGTPFSVLITAGNPAAIAVRGIILGKGFGYTN